MSESRLESTQNTPPPLHRRKRLSAVDAAALAAVELPSTGLHSTPGNLTPYFEKLAVLITSTPRAWLAPHLMRWSRTVLLDREVQERQPTRSEIRTTLNGIREAADFLQHSLPAIAVR